MEMASSTERSWLLVTKPILSSPSKGIVEVESTRGFHVKQKVSVKANSLERLELEVKAVLTETLMILGPTESNMDSKSDLSAYTSILGAIVTAPKQPRPSIDEKTYGKAVYEEEPAMAIRSLLVDRLGNDYNKDNPLNVKLSDGSIEIGNLEVQLSRKDNVPNIGDVHDSVRIGDRTNELKVNSDGSINVVFDNRVVKNIDFIYNEVLDVLPGVTTSIVTYTVPMGQTSSLIRVLGAGENIGRYDILINGIIIATQRTYFGSALDVNFELGSANGLGVLLVANDIVTLQVFQNRPDSANYEGTIEIIATPTALPENTIIKYSEVSSIPKDILQTVVTYIVPLGVTAALQLAYASGSNIAKYTIKINSNILATKRTYFGGDLNAFFLFESGSGGGLILTGGDIITLTAIHKRPCSANFEGTIKVLEY